MERPRILGGEKQAFKPLYLRERHFRMPSAETAMSAPPESPPADIEELLLIELAGGDALLGTAEPVALERHDHSFTERLKHRAHNFLARHSEYFARQVEISAACNCSGICPTCVGVTAGSFVAPLISNRMSSPRSAEQEAGPEDQA